MLNQNALYYPIADKIPLSELKKLLNSEELAHFTQGLVSIGMYPKNIKAKMTGEFREPKAGEWFLSGGIVEAYFARHNLKAKYHIAKLVKTIMIEMEIEA